MTADRYARHRLISWWDQDRVRAGRVLVAGGGALGNEVLKNLALLGVGQLLLIDFDRVEPSNLSRTVLFRESDVGLPKVEAAAEAVRRLNPDVTVRTIDGDVAFDVGLGHFRHCDLVVGCLDNLAARSRLGHYSLLAGKPHLDGGLWALGGEVRWFPGGDGPCFDCTLSDEDWQRLGERRSCTGFRAPEQQDAPAPTLATTAAVIGGLMAQEAAKWLCGQPVLEGKALVYNGQAMTMHRAELPRKPDCWSMHVPYSKVIELPCSAADLTPRGLLARARQESAHAFRVELGRDWVAAFRCPGCGAYEEVGQHQARIAEEARRCPGCQATRDAEVVGALDETHPLADRPLAALGVPPGDVVAVRAADGMHLFEMTADVFARSRTFEDTNAP